tara:strand:- start:73 stop:696 length:624 start_codon:yes stop_codon:yes gene_type:complete
MEFYTGLEKEVSEEIRAWSLHALEKPNPAYNNFPPCPFAAKAWQDEKVGILFKYDDSFQPLYSVISSYDDQFELVILIDFNYNENEEAFHAYLEDLNEAIADGIFIDKDIYLMGFHPETESNEIIENNDFETNAEEAYGIIFIQRLSLLHKTSEKLKKTTYYNRDQGSYNLDQIFEKRNELYRRLKSGKTNNISKKNISYGKKIKKI